MSRGFVPPKVVAPSGPPPRYVPPKGPKKAWVLGGGGGLLVVTVIVLRICLRLSRTQQPDAPDAPHLDDASRAAADKAMFDPLNPGQRAKADPPFATRVARPDRATPGTGPLADSPETMADVQRMLSGLAAVARAKNVDAMVSYLDGPRMFEMMHELGLLTHMSAADRDHAGTLFARGTARTLANADLLAADDVTAYRLLALPDPAEVLVYARATVANRHTKYRWWLRKTGPTWRAYDVEFLDGGFRLFDALATEPVICAPRGQSPAAWARYGDTYTDYGRQLLRRETAKASAAAALLDPTLFPPPMRARLLMMNGQTEWLLDRPAQALALYDQAEALDVDTPRVHYLRAAAYNGAQQGDRAIEAAGRYVLDVGADAAALRRDRPRAPSPRPPRPGPRGLPKRRGRRPRPRHDQGRPAAHPIAPAATRDARPSRSPC